MESITTGNMLVFFTRNFSKRRINIGRWSLSESLSFSFYDIGTYERTYTHIPAKCMHACIRVEWSDPIESQTCTGSSLQCVNAGMPTGSSEVY